MFEMYTSKQNISNPFVPAVCGLMVGYASTRSRIDACDDRAGVERESSRGGVRRGLKGVLNAVVVTGLVATSLGILLAGQSLIG